MAEENLELPEMDRHDPEGGELEAEAIGFIPVYGPNKTVIGRAKIRGGIIEVEVDDPEWMAFLAKENLIGMSTMYMNADRAEDALNEKEK